MLPPSHSRVLMKSPSPALHPPQKYKDRGISHPKRSADDRSDQSSVKSADSSYPSPCASPSPPPSGKVEYLKGDTEGQVCSTSNVTYLNKIIKQFYFLVANHGLSSRYKLKLANLRHLE